MHLYTMYAFRSNNNIHISHIITKNQETYDKPQIIDEWTKTFFNRNKP
jgi:hypothetical protein